MSELLNSIRMRAERGGVHISGAERLVAFEDLQETTLAMLKRALQHPRGPAERISIKVDSIDPTELLSGVLPDLHNNQVCSWQQGRELATEILRSCGVEREAVLRAMADLTNGAAPGGRSMRGAMLIDADTGERLELDPARGVRASRMDLSEAALSQLCPLLAAYDLNNSHVIEAITLAAKVISAPAVIAELCWSDDPDYVAGYVAAQKTGYQRINLLKPNGEERGGRAFFIRCSKERLARLVAWLEKQPFLIEKVGRIHPPRKWRCEL